MTSAIALAWLVSAPMLVILGAFNVSVAQCMWKPPTRASKTLVWSALSAGSLAAMLHLFGPAITIAGTPLLIWAGLFLLIVVWCRLIVVRRGRPTMCGR